MRRWGLYGDRPLCRLEPGTHQVDRGNAIWRRVDKGDLLDYLARLPVAAHSETPAESGSKPDLCALGVQDLEVGSVREPAFEPARNLLAPGANLGASRE